MLQAVKEMEKYEGKPLKVLKEEAGAMAQQARHRAEQLRKELGIDPLTAQSEATREVILQTASS
jgi:hypothetical protein